MKPFIRNENEFNQRVEVLNVVELKFIDERVCINTFTAVDE